MSDPKLKFILEVDDKGTAVVKSFAGGLDDAGQKTKGFSGELGGLAASAASAVAKIVALGAATVAAVAGMTLKSAITEFAEFEEKLTDLGKLGVENLGAIKSEIMALPVALGNATQLTSGYYQVLSSGITDAKESIDTLITSSQLAKAAHIEQATSVQAVTAGMKAFKVSGDEVADSLLRIEKSGVTTVGQLAPIFGQVSGMASGLNMQLNETSAALAAVTQQSGSTEKGATQLMAIMQELIKPTDAMNAVFEKYGGTVAAIKQIGFEGVLREIADATGGTAEGIGALVGSSEALSGILTLTSNNMEFFNAAMDDQTAKAGSLSAAWEAYKNTLPGIWDTAKNFITDQAILIGEHLAPKIKEVVGDFIAWGEANRTLIETKIGEWIDGFVNSIGKVDFDDLAEKASSFAHAISKTAEFFTNLYDVVTVLLIPLKGWADIANLIIIEWQTATGQVSEQSKKMADDVSSAAETASAALKTIQPPPDIEVKVNTDQAVQAVNDIKNKMAEVQQAVSGKPIEITANTDPAVQAVLDLKDQIAAGKIAIPVDANTDSASDNIEKLKYEVDGKEFWIAVSADTKPAMTATDELKAQIQNIKESAEVAMRLGLEPTEALQDLADLKQQIARDEAMLKISGDGKPVTADMERIKKDISATEAALKVIADTDPAKQQAESARTGIDGMTATIKVNVDTTEAMSQLKELHNFATNWDSRQNLTDYNKQNSHSSMTDAQARILNKYGAYVDERYGWVGLNEAMKKAKEDPAWADAGKVTGYAIGTGNPGLPATGIFQGHAGELMLSKQASDMVRQYGIGSASAVAALVSGYTASDQARMGSVMAGLDKTGLYYGERGQIIYTKSDSDQILASMPFNHDRPSVTGPAHAEPRMSMSSLGSGVMGSYYSGTGPALKTVDRGEAQGIEGFSGMGHTTNYITVAPRMMTGDRQTARRMGREIHGMLQTVTTMWGK